MIDYYQSFASCSYLYSSEPSLSSSSESLRHSNSNNTFSIRSDVHVGFGFPSDVTTSWMLRSRSNDNVLFGCFGIEYSDWRQQASLIEVLLLLLAILNGALSHRHDGGFGELVCTGFLAAGLIGNTSEGEEAAAAAELSWLSFKLLSHRERLCCFLLFEEDSRLLRLRGGCDDAECEDEQVPLL